MEPGSDAGHGDVSGAGPGNRLAEGLEPERTSEPERSHDEVLAAFDQTNPFSLALEEELMLLHPKTFDLAPLADAVLARVQDPRFHPGVRTGRIAIVTPVAGNARAAGIHLAQARLDLAGALAPDALVVAAGTYPFSSRWGEVPDGADSRETAGEHPHAAALDDPCSLHVHVGFGPAERVLTVFNAARSFLPELAALAANSPFAEGADTGLASARRLLTSSSRRSGVPPPFPTWRDFLGFLGWASTAGLLPDGTHPRWDLRPHTTCGTLELRITDAQTRVEDTAAIAAVFQSLAAHLARLAERGLLPPPHATERIEENAWRAVRDGVRGTMVDLETGRVEPTRDRIGRLLDRIEPDASELGNLDLLHVAHLLLADNGAERQRYVFAARGFDGLARWLSDETASSAGEYLSRRA